MQFIPHVLENREWKASEWIPASLLLLCKSQKGAFVVPL